MLSANLASSNLVTRLIIQLELYDTFMLKSWMFNDNYFTVRFMRAVKPDVFRNIQKMLICRIIELDFTSWISVIHMGHILQSRALHLTLSFHNLSSYIQLWISIIHRIPHSWYCYEGGDIYSPALKCFIQFFLYSWKTVIECTHVLHLHSSNCILV